MTNPDLSIIAMAPADLEQFMRIERLAHAFPWTEGIMAGCFQPGYLGKALVSDRVVYGYGVLQFIVDEAHLLNISVDPDRQGNGYGRQLLAHLIEAAEHVAQTMFLEVRPSNSAAITLYQSVGFNEVGLRRNYYPAKGGGREDALLMALALGDGLFR